MNTSTVVVVVVVIPTSRGLFFFFSSSRRLFFYYTRARADVRVGKRFGGFVFSRRPSRSVSVTEIKHRSPFRDHITTRKLIILLKP